MSWLSDLIDRITHTSTVDFVLTSPLSGDPSAPAPAAVPNDSYVTARVASLRLPNTRDHVFEKLYGVVYAFSTVSRIGVASVKFASTTMPKDLAGVSSKNLGRVLQVDKRVVGPTPYPGGDFTLQLGLFSVVGENLAKPFLDTITALSGKIGTGFAAAAAPFVDVLQLGIETFTQSSGSVKLEIGLDQDFKGPTTGLRALVAVDKTKVDPTKFTVDPSDRKLLYGGQPYADKPYLVFSIEASVQREDWGDIPELAAAYAAVVKAVRDKDEQVARAAAAAFRLVALTNGDLIASDADRISEIVDDLVDRAFAKPALRSAVRLAALPGPPKERFKMPVKLRDLPLY